jgi:membrane protein implicated in regulation of membrane protease activity
MYLIVIAWFYVTLMMALAEAFSTQGSVLGAIITFVLYGLVPMSLVVYLMGTPLRRKARQKEERHAAQRQAQERALAEAGKRASAPEPDASGHAPGLPQDRAVASVRKEP